MQVYLHSNYLSKTYLEGFMDTICENRDIAIVLKVEIFGHLNEGNVRSLIHDRLSFYDKQELFSVQLYACIRIYRRTYKITHFVLACLS